MPGTYRPIPRYPAVLGTRIAQADHLARALQSLFNKATPGDPSYRWLFGRAEEVRTLVNEIAREWSEGAVDTAYACEAIRSYVGAVHVALHQRYGGIGGACCGPHLEPLSSSTGSMQVAAVRAPLQSEVHVVAAEEAPASRARPLAPLRKSG
jgi:hypothetical protein